MLTVGGLLLGVLGAIGGEVTLFKGLKQMQELPGLAATTTARRASWCSAVIKLFALLVAATSGFRGGRIFPTLFIGVALGFAIHQAWASVSLPLAVGCACVGILVAATRSGWLSIFMAVAVVPQMVAAARVAPGDAGRVAAGDQPAAADRTEGRGARDAPA